MYFLLGASNYRSLCSWLKLINRELLKNAARQRPEAMLILARGIALFNRKIVLTAPCLHRPAGALLSHF